MDILIISNLFFSLQSVLFCTCFLVCTCKDFPWGKLNFGVKLLGLKNAKFNFPLFSKVVVTVYIPIINDMCMFYPTLARLTHFCYSN